MAEKELTPEQEREKTREVALSNLKSNVITDLASAYFVNESGQYGEAGDSAIEQFKYFPALQSEQGQAMFMKGLAESRQGKKRYTGNVSEYKIISDCAKIMQESLLSLKVEDVLGLMGSKVDLKEEYKNKYFSELAGDEEAIKNIIGSYMQYFTDTKTSEALSQKAEFSKSGLENILKEPKEGAE